MCIRDRCAYVGITLKDLDNKPYKKQAAAK